MSFFQQTSQPGGAYGGMASQNQLLDDRDFEVQHQFSDAIALIKFAPLTQAYQSFGTPILAVAGWDGNIQVYQVNVIGE